MQIRYAQGWQPYPLSDQKYLYFIFKEKDCFLFRWFLCQSDMKICSEETVREYLNFQVYMPYTIRVSQTHINPGITQYSQTHINPGISQCSQTHINPGITQYSQTRINPGITQYSQTHINPGISQCSQTRINPGIT